MKPRHAYSLCLGAAVLMATPGMRAQSADPWARAVALPTACYQSQDQFAAKAQTAAESLSADISKQEAINSSKSGQMSNDTDPFALAQRMQEMMMKDPQAAMKLMQGMGATDPAAQQAEMMAQNEKRTKWEADEKALRSRFQAARKQAFAPLEAQQAALDKKYENATESTTAMVAEYEAVTRNHDRIYATTLCPQWFGATGQFTTFVKRYKDYLVTDRIPADEKLDSQKVAATTLMGNSASGFKSVAALHGVEDYLKLAERLFADRENESLCTALKCH